MALTTAGLIAKLAEAVQAFPSATQWGARYGIKHQNVTAAMRGDVLPTAGLVKALGYRRVLIQAYLAPGENVAMLPPGYEQVEPDAPTRPLDWTPPAKVAFDRPPVATAMRDELSRVLAGGEPAPTRKAKKVG